MRVAILILAISANAFAGLYDYVWTGPNGLQWKYLGYHDFRSGSQLCAQQGTMPRAQDITAALPHGLNTHPGWSYTPGTNILSDRHNNNTFCGVWASDPAGFAQAWAVQTADYGSPPGAPQMGSDGNRCHTLCLVNGIPNPPPVNPPAPPPVFPGTQTACGGVHSPSLQNYCYNVYDPSGQTVASVCNNYAAYGIELHGRQRAQDPRCRGHRLYGFQCGGVNSPSLGQYCYTVFSGATTLENVCLPYASSGYELHSRLRAEDPRCK